MDLQAEQHTMDGFGARPCSLTSTIYWVSGLQHQRRAVPSSMPRRRQSLVQTAMELVVTIREKSFVPAVWWAMTGAIMADGRSLCIEKILPSKCLSLPRNGMPCEAMQVVLPLRLNDS